MGPPATAEHCPNKLPSSTPASPPQPIAVPAALIRCTTSPRCSSQTKLSNSRFGWITAGQNAINGASSATGTAPKIAQEVRYGRGLATGENALNHRQCVRMREVKRKHHLMPNAPNVAILLAVYNGGVHLAEQLDSIAAQTHREWVVLASDDGSLDNSRSQLEIFAQRHPLILIDGPRRGSAENFLSLLRRRPVYLPNIRWLAFSDQDDIWLPDKMERGLAALSVLPEDRPALYCSRTWISDSNGRPLRLSPPRPRPPSFRNALVQNICSGNTILLNPAATTLATAAAAEVASLAFHDWWLYQLVTGAGGQVVHDNAPMLFYRQHASNEMGANDSFAARYRRIHLLMRGDFRGWNRVNIAALNASFHRLTEGNQGRLAVFAALCAGSLPERLLGLARLRLYRQSRASTVAVWLSAVLRRL